MPTAILIAFEYTSNSLTGAIIDLYHAYSWCTSFGVDKIYIITDITRVNYPDNLKHAVNRKLANPDIIHFYHQIADTIILADDHISIMNALNSVEVTDDKLIIYYTGHGVKDSIVLPNKTLLPFIDFRNCILNKLNPYVEIFWILDCCNPNGLHLPFKLYDTQYSLSSSKVECVSNPILLITSSEPEEKSVATCYGSIFSRHLFRLLLHINNSTHSNIGHKNRNLRRLIGNLSSSIRKMNTGYNQTVSVYSSYITDPILWMWIGAPKSSDIVCDLSLSVLVIRDR